MKLYTKANSENSTKQVTKGGNNFIATEYFATDRERANFRTMFLYNENNGIIRLTFEKRKMFSDGWQQVAEEYIYTNIKK